ncbi:MAG: hypothetical protein NC916_03230 [Candidatus Omnitrophica bacterium]|nr:hypothetical protein [Candidatus Omnitrophota bacterium]
MLVALDISLLSGLLGFDEAERIKLLIEKTGLPTKIKGVSLNRIINAHYHDKKFIGKTNRFVLLEKIGRVKISQNIPLGLIREAIALRLS